MAAEMEALTQAEQAELAGEMWTMVQDLKLVGLHAVLVVQGRGITKTAYSKDSAHLAAPMLAAAWHGVQKHNASQAN